MYRDPFICIALDAFLSNMAYMLEETTAIWMEMFDAWTVRRTVIWTWLAATLLPLQEQEEQNHASVSFNLSPLSNFA